MRDVIFDLDGTLIDSLPGIEWSAEAAFLACGLSWLQPNLRPLIGPPIRRILAIISGVVDAVDLDRLEAAFRLSYDAAGWRRTVRQPGAFETLRELQASGIAMWMVTNKPVRATFQILHELDLVQFFEDVVCANSRRPAFESKAAMLADLLARHRLDRAGCLMVGDTMEDARAAAEAGIACVLTPHGYGRGLQGHVLRDWTELLDRLGTAAPVSVMEGRI